MNTKPNQVVSAGTFDWLLTYVDIWTCHHISATRCLFAVWHLMVACVHKRAHKENFDRNSIGQRHKTDNNKEVWKRALNS